MRKNRKHSKEQMYATIEAWQQSGLSQNRFCKDKNLSVSTFSYWISKYKKEKEKEKDPANRTDSNPFKTFLPVEVSKGINPGNKGCITITYPNGIQVCCPVNLE